MAKKDFFWKYGKHSGTRCIVQFSCFNSTSTLRDEYLIARKKHIDKISVSTSSFGTYETKYNASSPISAEVLVAGSYESDDRCEYFIYQIQNGKVIEICADSAYTEYIDDDFFEVFNHNIAYFKNKGFEVVEEDVDVAD